MERKRPNQGGVDAATAARQFWPFGYYPATGTAQVGPVEINIGQARRQARQLFRAICTAARAVDAAVAGKLTQAPARKDS